MFDAVHFKEEIVEPVLQEMSEHFYGAYSPAAVNLMMGTVWQESLGGTWLRQWKGGPGKGVYQIEPATHLDIFENFLAYRLDDCEYVLSYWPLSLMRAPASITDNPSQAISDVFAKVSGSSLEFAELHDSQAHDLLVYNLRYATVIARLKYWRNNFTWPDDPNDILTLGVIWDTIYNANPEHGLPADFVANFPKGILT